MKLIHPKPLAALVLAIAAGLPVARAADKHPAGTSAQAPEGIQAMLRGINGIQRLPVAGVQMVQAGGRVLFVSANGRYVFTGPAWDLWHGAKLESLEEGARLAERIDLKGLGLDPATLGALDLGSGDRGVVAFVDPHCPHCRSLLDQLPALAERYRFRLVPLPVLEPDSEALLADKLDRLPPLEGTCGQASAQRALVTAQLLGIAGVPYLIAPDGRTQQGVPADLDARLESNE